MNEILENIRQQWEKLINEQNNDHPADIKENIVNNFSMLLQDHLLQVAGEEPYNKHIQISETEVRQIVEQVPVLLDMMHVQVRKFTTSCHSCIITENECVIAEQLLQEKLFYRTKEQDDERNQHSAVFNNFCREIFYAVPYIFKQNGFELFRPDEQLFVNDRLAGKLARAIHSRYSKLMQDVITDPGKKSVYKDMYIVADESQQYFNMSFEELPDYIRQANTDNAYHIPTKLLALGYAMREGKSDETIPLLYLSDSDVETMAMMEHERWNWEKRLNGFRYAAKRDDHKKKHNCLVPYAELAELEKEKDRVLVRLIPVLLQDIGYVPYPLSPELTKSVVYPHMATAKIHQVRYLSEDVTKSIREFLKENKLELPQDINASLEKITDSAKEVGAAIASAGTIQRTYLPSPLFFRECLPDSFLLFKPKDIVGGDFYFVSRKFGATVFVAADCTGHGIQGALLSALCYNYIDQAVNDRNITDPAAIIANVMPRVEHIMQYQEGNIVNKSGMELAVCTLYDGSDLLFYAGINRPLYYYSNSQLNELSPVKSRENFGIVSQSMQTRIVKLNPGDTIYILSDGFVDQFGGSNTEGGERFKIKRFRELICSMQHQNMTEQKETMNQTIEKWRQQASQEQTDDIIVIGVKV